MSHIELKVARIGNSRGVRIPATTLVRYQIKDTVVMEERSDGILLRVPAPAHPRLSWEETARAMADAAENWADWETASADGLTTVPWESRHARKVAERPAEDRGRRRR